MFNRLAPLFAVLVGVASGVYIFQPVVLEQLKKDGALKPEYQNLEAEIEGALGDVTNSQVPAKNPKFQPPSQEQLQAWDRQRQEVESRR